MHWNTVTVGVRVSSGQSGGTPKWLLFPFHTWHVPTNTCYHLAFVFSVNVHNVHQFIGSSFDWLLWKHNSNNKMSFSIATSVICYIKVTTTSCDALGHKRSQRSCSKTDKWIIWSEFEPFGPITRLTAQLNHFSCLPLKLHTLFGHQNEEDPGDFMSWKSSFLGFVHQWAAFIGVMWLRLQICIQVPWSGCKTVSMPLVANFNGFSCNKSENIMIT